MDLRPSLNTLLGRIPDAEVMLESEALPARRLVIGAVRVLSVQGGEWAAGRLDAAADLLTRPYVPARTQDVRLYAAAYGLALDPAAHSLLGQFASAIFTYTLAQLENETAVPGR